jgi:hypothetical protein
MSEKSRREQANRQQKLGLVWRNRKKISQINQRLLLLTVLPLNFFMARMFRRMREQPQTHSLYPASLYSSFLRRYDMNRRSQMQEGKTWIFPKEINANRFF